MNTIITSPWEGWFSWEAQKRPQLDSNDIWAVTWSNAQLWGQSFSGREQDPTTTEPGMFEDQKKKGMGSWRRVSVT